MNRLKVILASASPRRHQFLACFGLPHRIETADIDETPRPGESPTGLVRRLAAAKAQAVGQRLGTTDAGRGELLVIGADTVVALGEEILGKPSDGGEARQMLEKLRDAPHQVHSGVAVAHFVMGSCQGLCISVNSTGVVMRDYTNDEIAEYIQTGDPLDKAGAYAIQHQQFDPVARLRGCPAGVMGLPAADVQKLLRKFGISCKRTPAQCCPGLTGFPCCQATPDTKPDPEISARAD